MSSVTVTDADIRSAIDQMYVKYDLNKDMRLNSA